MINTERTILLHNLVRQGNAEVIEKILECKGDSKKEDEVFKEYNLIDNN